jgi:hypothetical protein
MDVTLGRADDPNADDFNGILDYKAMTLDEAMRVYWFMKNMNVTGASSVSSSATFSGSYKRIIKKLKTPLTNPRQYDLETVEEWSTSVNPNSLSDTSNMALTSTSGSSGRNHTPVEPSKRVCTSKKVIKDFRMEGIELSDFDKQPESGGKYIGAGTSCEMGSMYYHSHGYGDGDAATAFLMCPPNLYSFYDNNEFVGYGFTQFCSGECVVSCGAGVNVPSDVPSYHDDTSIGIFIGGFFSIRSVVYTEEFGQWAGTGKYQTVKFADVDMIASSSGTEDVTISDSGGGVKFSYSDSDTGTPTFDYDGRDSDGAGVTFTGNGQMDCAGSFDITFKEPTFYNYPSW